MATTLKELATIFRANLQAMRRAARLSQAELARMTQIDPSQLSQLELGGTRPNFGTLCRLSAALKVEPWELLAPRKKPA